MKSKSVLCLGLLLAMGVMVNAAEVGTVKSNILNVRLKPQPKSEIIIKLHKNAKVDIIESSNEVFYKIAAPKTTPVYVFGENIKDGKIIKISSMRSGVSKFAAVYGVLEVGDSVEVVPGKEHKGWVKIVPPQDLVLYVAKDYIIPGGEVKNAEVKKQDNTISTPASSPAAPKEVPAAVEPAGSNNTQLMNETDKKNLVQEKISVPAVKPTTPAAAINANEKVFNQKVEDLTKIYQDLNRLNAKMNSKNEETANGYIFTIKAAADSPVKYALMKQVGDKYENIFFICNGNIDFQELVGKNVQIKGLSYLVSDWKTPVIVVSSVKYTTDND